MHYLRVSTRSQDLDNQKLAILDYAHRKQFAVDRFIAIKEGIEFDGKQDLQTKVMIALFGLFSEDERDLISERTKEGLAAAEAQGKMLSRPKGKQGKSKLDGKEQDIRRFLELGVSKTAIVKVTGVSPTTSGSPAPESTCVAMGTHSMIRWFRYRLRRGQYPGRTNSASSARTPV